MKSKFITDQNEWIECLSLKYPWGKKLSPVICSTEALGELSDKVETGYFIAKQKFIIHSIPLCKKQTEFKSRIIREKRVMSMDYLICRSEVWQDNEILVQLESTLVRNGVQKIKEQRKTEIEQEFIKTIRTCEVNAFSELSGDPNYIHKGDKPVVQAMFLLLLLEDYLAVRNRFVTGGEISYYIPVKAECDLFLFRESDSSVTGIVNNEKCFKLEIKGEFK